MKRILTALFLTIAAMSAVPAHAGDADTDGYVMSMEARCKFVQLTSKLAASLKSKGLTEAEQNAAAGRQPMDTYSHREFNVQYAKAIHKIYIWPQYEGLSPEIIGELERDTCVRTNGASAL